MMVAKRLANVVGFDDAPFKRTHEGDVPIVGAVYADRRFDGVLIGRIEKDGVDAARRLIDMISGSRFAEHIRLILLQGIAFGGFNVVDVYELHERLGVPAMVVSRRQPDMGAIKNALLKHIPGGQEKWRIIERLGPMEPLGKIYIQRVALSFEQAAQALDRLAMHGNIPEPLRAAHMIASALVNGQSRGQP